MFCSHCNRYYTDLVDHVLEHLGAAMTTPTSIAALADQLNGLLPQVQALKADNDLTPIAAAVKALADELNPSVAVEAPTD